MYKKAHWAHWNLGALVSPVSVIFAVFFELPVTLTMASYGTPIKAAYVGLQ